MSEAVSLRDGNPPTGDLSENGKTEEGGVEPPAAKDAGCETNGTCGENERERVVKQVGLTSTAFIGPAFPPQKDAPKPDLENSLSEFYKELEEIDGRQHGADESDRDGRDEGFALRPRSSTSGEMQNANPQEFRGRRHRERNAFHRNSELKSSSWPHWYQNEPYHARWPRSGADPNDFRGAPTQDPRYYPPPVDREPDPSFRGPPFHCPPLPYPDYELPHTHATWRPHGIPNQHRGFPEGPPLPQHHLPPQGFYEETPPYFDGYESGYSMDARADYENGRWYDDPQEIWQDWGEDFDMRQGFDSGNDLWEQQHHCRPPDETGAHHSSQVLILLRGLPGSGKSTMARKLLSDAPGGLILSTDDYFAQEDGYRYNPGLLGKAHEWNQCRAKDAMHERRSPIIIDNTNIQAWEMKPYVQMALEQGYRVDFCEPDTDWKFDPCELEKRNKHAVPRDKIAQMMDRFSSPVSVSIVMNSQEPRPGKKRRRR